MEAGEVPKMIKESATLRDTERAPPADGILPHPVLIVTALGIDTRPWPVTDS